MFSKDNLTVPVQSFFFLNYFLFIVTISFKEIIAKNGYIYITALFPYGRPA